MFTKRKRTEILWWQQLPQQWMLLQRPQQYHHHHRHHRYNVLIYHRHNNNYYYDHSQQQSSLSSTYYCSLRTNQRHLGCFISQIITSKSILNYCGTNITDPTTRIKSLSSTTTTGFRRNSTNNVLYSNQDRNQNDEYIISSKVQSPIWHTSLVRDHNDDESQIPLSNDHSYHNHVTTAISAVTNPSKTFNSSLLLQELHQQLLHMTVQFLKHGIDSPITSTNTVHDHNYKQNIAMIQNLLERWIQCYYSYDTTKHIQRSHHHNHTSKDISLRFITILFQKWFHYLQEQQQRYQHPIKDNISNPELMHYLYRILYMMQQESKQHYHNSKSHKNHHRLKSNSNYSNMCIQKSYQLLQSFYNYSINQNQPQFHPKPKAYSMVLEALSYYNVGPANDNIVDHHHHQNHHPASEISMAESDSPIVVTTDSWNTSIIIDMADELMQQLHELCNKYIITTTKDIKHRYDQLSPYNNIIPDDILVTQNSYLRLLARYSTTRPNRYGNNSADTTTILERRHPPTLDLAEKAETYLWDYMSSSQQQQQHHHCTIQRLPPNMKSYSAVLQAYVNQNAPEQACKVLNRMIDQRIIPDQICYNICLQALGNAGQATQAHHLLLQMIQLSKGDNNDNSNNALLLQPPDVYSYLAVIKAYANCCDVTNVIHLFEQMIKNNIWPNAVIYNTVLDVLAHQPNSGPLVEQMLRYLERLHYGSDISITHGPNIASSLYVKPCREAYTIAVRAWGNTTNDVSAPDHATNIFRRMQSLSSLQQQEQGMSSDIGVNSKNDDNGLSPCTISYTSLIHAWAQSCRKDAPGRALQILRYMEQKQHSGVIPDTITYNVVLSAMARHGLATEAHQLLNEMIERMMRNVNDNKQRTMYPNCISWATVIQAYTKSKCPDAGMKANDLVLELEHLYDTTGIRSLQPMADIYSVVILAQSWGDHTDLAEQTFWRMIDRYEQSSTLKNIPPNTSVCNALLRLWSYSSDPVAPQRAEMILRWMEDHTAAAQRDDGAHSLDLAPNIDSYHYILQTWHRSKRRNANLHIQNIQRKLQHYKSSQHLK